MATDIFESMKPLLPEVLTRKDITKFFGALISPRYLANLDSNGTGPERTRVGRKIVYKKDDFIKWLSARIKA